MTQKLKDVYPEKKDGIGQEEQAQTLDVDSIKRLDLKKDEVLAVILPEGDRPSEKVVKWWRDQFHDKFKIQIAIFMHGTELTVVKKESFFKFLKRLFRWGSQ